MYSTDYPHTCCTSWSSYLLRASWSWYWALCWCCWVSAASVFLFSSCSTFNLSTSNWRTYASCFYVKEQGWREGEGSEGEGRRVGEWEEREGVGTGIGSLSTFSPLTLLPLPLLLLPLLPQKREEDE